MTETIYIDIDTLRQTFSDYLKKNKLRHTIERDAIFTKICQTTDSFTVDEIWKELEIEKFHVSHASIYNTIKLILDAKIIVRHQFSFTNIQYELKHIAELYHHAICTHCGSVRSIKNEKTFKNIPKYKISKFTSEYHILYFYGICSKCKYQRVRKAIKKKTEK